MHFQYRREPPNTYDTKVVLKLEVSTVDHKRWYTQQHKNPNATYIPYHTPL